MASIVMMTTAYTNDSTIDQEEKKAEKEFLSNVVKSIQVKKPESEDLAVTMVKVTIDVQNYEKITSNTDDCGQTSSSATNLVNMQNTSSNEDISKSPPENDSPRTKENSFELIVEENLNKNETSPEKRDNFYSPTRKSAGLNNLISNNDADNVNCESGEYTETLGTCLESDAMRSGSREHAESSVDDAIDLSMNLEDLQESIDNINVKRKSFQWSSEVPELYHLESVLSFHKAVRDGDAKYIAALLKNGCVLNLDEPDWNVSADPPLLVAATNHCLPVLSTLLAHGCDPSVRSGRGETALHRVILNGGPENILSYVEELLKYGCPSGVKEAGGGLTALHILTRQLVHAQSSKSLHYNFEVALKTLKLLAKAGPVNAKDHQGRSALHFLASSMVFDNNHKKEIGSLIETLLAAGADPALKNDRGETALHECLECGALNTAILLIPHTPPGIMSRYGETPLHIASRKDYAYIVIKLLAHGEDPSLQDAGGNTSLHLASARGFIHTVSLLIKSPLTQLEKTNTEGLTAVQVAAESKFLFAVELLLKAGADQSQVEHYIKTLHRPPNFTADVINLCHRSM